MELVSILLILLLAWAIFKAFGFFFDLAAFVILLPIKLLALAIATLLVVFVLIPIGLVAGIASIVVAPLALLLPVLPFLLIGLGIYLLVRHRQTNVPPR